MNSARHYLYEQSRLENMKAERHLKSENKLAEEPEKTGTLFIQKIL